MYLSARVDAAAIGPAVGELEKRWEAVSREWKVPGLGRSELARQPLSQTDIQQLR